MVESSIRVAAANVNQIYFAFFFLLLRTRVFLFRRFAGFQLKINFVQTQTVHPFHKFRILFAFNKRFIAAEIIWIVQLALRILSVSHRIERITRIQHRKSYNLPKINIIYECFDVLSMNRAVTTTKFNLVRARLYSHPQYHMANFCSCIERIHHFYLPIHSLCEVCQTQCTVQF